MKENFRFNKIFLFIFILFILFFSIQFVFAQENSSSGVEWATEEVKCYFSDSKEVQKCYTSEGDYGCSGVESCVVSAGGAKGYKVLWKSSCGGYEYNIMDGVAETIEFDCDEKEISCTIPFCEFGDAYKTGEVDSNGCAIYKCPEKGYSCQEGCTCDEKGNILSCDKPICGNGICEKGEGEICTVASTTIPCEVGKDCEVSGSCYLACPQDCEIVDSGIYTKLNQEFKFKVGQSAKVIDYADMLIKFIDVTELIESSDESEEDSSSSFYGAVAKLSITFKEEPTKTVNIKLGEKKEVFDVTLSFLDFNSNFRNGYFIVSSKKIEDCEEGCICNIDGSMECPSYPSCEEGTALCPDGVCREKCDVTLEEKCTFGCLYGKSCLPIGTRVSGDFCSINRDLEPQLESSSVCENNFECSSNLCIDNQCVEKGLFSKIVEWFKKVFG